MRTERVAISELSTVDRAAMYDLLSCHFDGATPAVFDTDLSLKNWVLLLKDESYVLKGFSTLLMYDIAFEGELITVVYSGDTIMDPSVWSSSALSQAWVTAVNELRGHYKGARLYWLLISSGFRTYRFLPTFWQIFYPRHDQAIPEDMRRLMQFLCRRQFGAWYDDSTGVVRFPEPQRLKGHLEGIPAERLRNPHVSFFAARNPEASNGDELVCLTEICEENLTRAGRRMWFAQTPVVGG